MLRENRPKFDFFLLLSLCWVCFSGQALGMVPCLGRSSATLQVLVPGPSCYTHVYYHRNARNVQPVATDQLLASFVLILQQGSHHESSFLPKCHRGPANSQELGLHCSFSCSPLWVTWMLSLKIHMLKISSQHHRRRSNLEIVQPEGLGQSPGSGGSNKFQFRRRAAVKGRERRFSECGHIGQKIK